MTISGGKTQRRTYASIVASVKSEKRPETPPRPESPPRPVSPPRPAPLSTDAPLPPPLPEDLCCLRPSTSKAIKIKLKAPESKRIHCGFVPTTALEAAKYTQEVLSFADNWHRPVLEKVAEEFKTALNRVMPEVEVWITGSLPAKMEITGSDLDFTVKMPEDDTRRGADKLWAIRDRMKDLCSDAFQSFRIVGARVPLLQMNHRKTGILIDVTVDNDGAKWNTQLLVWYGQLEPNFPILCRAIKRWAKHVGVLGAPLGRLNSFTLALLVIHFLQRGTQPAVLPNLQELFPEIKEEMELESDDYERRNLREELEQSGRWCRPTPDPMEDRDKWGILFVGFLRYYARFNFEKRWISVRRGKDFNRRYDKNGEPLGGMPDSPTSILIEDPFITKNCGYTVWNIDVFRRLNYEFRASFKRTVAAKTIFTCGQTSEWRRRIEREAERSARPRGEWSMFAVAAFPPEPNKTYDYLKKVPWPNLSRNW